jgi:GNAT superfamily N-acetyltransferase
MKIDASRLSRRDAADVDRVLAYDIKKAALRAYVEPIWGWDESFQVEFHRKDWAEVRPQFIRMDGREIGTIEIRRNSGSFHLGEFYLLPEFQRQGIGSHFLSQLTVRADDEGIPVRLDVIRINPVQTLYRRFGFVIVGETRTHYLMERTPNPARRSASPLQTSS